MGFFSIPLMGRASFSGGGCFSGGAGSNGGAMVARGGGVCRIRQNARGINV